MQNDRVDRTEIIKMLCSYLNNNDREKCKELIESKYPFKPVKYDKRSYSKKVLTEIFIRDGFIDRYSGQKLIFPPVLRILSLEFPDEFPFHNNWKMSQCHLAYWELCPTVDHVIPIASGGLNTKDNLICTSMLRNSAKSNFTLEELNWVLLPSGDYRNWDGLSHWFIDYVLENGELLKNDYMRSWYNALKKTLNE